MSEENENQIEQPEPQESAAEETTPETTARRRFFTRRNGVIALGLIALLAVGVAILVTVSYRYGVFDNYIKEQFVAKMAEIGIVFSADVFRVTISPLQLELKNATFNDKITGDKLFFINDAKLGLTVQDLYAWQLSRDITIDTTDVQGAEVWVRFDENGKSNFSNLQIFREETRINFTYSSTKFSLKEGLIHFGDASRKISADAKNVLFFFEPENYDVPDEEKRYKFDLTSTNSTFVYDESPIEPIDIRAKGVADDKGAEISELKLTSPIGESTLNGTITDWELLKYNLNIESTVDLTQASSVLPMGTAIRGIGNFSGKVTGEGAKYNIEGEVQSDALAADNIRLKGLNIAATVAGENSMYDINGKAVAELLTFEDFQINALQLVGNIRGTGTDFKWLGELQAAAAKSPLGTIAGLYITDAVAEYKDEQLSANLGNVRAQRFSSEDVEIQTLLANNVEITNADGTTNVSAPNVRVSSVKTDDATLRGVNAGDVRISNRGDRTDVKTGNVRASSVETADATLRGVNADEVVVANRGDKTDVKAGNVRAENVETEDLRLRNLRAGNVDLISSGNQTRVTADNVQADGLDADGAKVGNLTASNVDVQIVGNETLVYSDNLRVAKLETDAAILGSLNVAGVRLTIRQGRIEATSGDINAGNVALTNSTIDGGGNLENVKLFKPVFVLEPSGRYRASADMSLGGGVLGSIRLGAARANVVAQNDQVALNNLSAEVLDGNVNGNAVIALNNRNRSQVDAEFSNLDLAKLLALQGGQVVPVDGKTTGNANLTFAGTNFKTASGTITADFTANAGTAERGLVPVNGKLGLTATDGLFNVDFANLFTDKTELKATGSFDLNGYDSNLNVALNSTDASEIERIVRVLNLSPEVEAQLDKYQAKFAGNLTFNGTLTGKLTDPTIDGRAALDSIILRGRDLGSLSTAIFVSPGGIELRDGKLQERGEGGNLAFNVNIPTTGANNITVQATLNQINTGNLIAALPIDFLPETLRGLQAQTSGTVNLSGLPGDIQGTADISSGKGTINGQPFDGFDVKANFQGNLANIEKFEARFGDGFLRANGTLNTDSTAFDFDVEGKDIQLTRIRPFIPNSENLPNITGVVDLTAKATGRTSDSKTYDINFSGVGRNVLLNENVLGEVTFNGRTENQILNANLTANFQGQPQAIVATVNFADENLPFRAETTFNNTELAPFIALASPPDTVTISGTATGRVFLEGNLSTLGADGKRSFSTENLSGAAQFSQFALQIGETPLIATEPIAVRFNSKEVVVDNAKFSGGGSNILVNGTVALTDDGVNNLTVDGKINLSVFNALSKNTFFAGIADISVRLTGTKNARLNGTAELQNASAATFIGTERISFDRIKGRIIFTTNQAQIDNLSAFLGGGRVTASGGALLDGLTLQGFRLDVRGNNFTAPLPPDFITTGDAEIQISGNRINGEMNTLIAGTIFTRRSIYNQDIDLADFISGRREGSLTANDGSSSGSSSFLGVPKLDIRLEGRDALVVRNNLADLTASISLRVTGDVEFPQISGRVTANSGTIFFRKDRYEVQRGVLEFPPNTSIEPFINLQAETEINGYQIIVNLVGELANTESLNATVRSSPALPQADVISLITTGNLANTDTGIPTLAQSGINTAAEILTDELINNPLSRATNKLFGLNRFEIDPVISGQRLNPSARLTVGRQINRNLLITYSTNLSEDQNQILALEYRVSNRLSFVAQYEQRSLSNVTQRNNSFSFDVRLRKRF